LHRRIASEIDEVRSGLWDNKIKAKISGVILAEEAGAVETLHSHDPSNIAVSISCFD